MNKVRTKKLETLTEKVKKMQVEIEQFLFEEEEKISTQSKVFMRLAIDNLSYSVDNLEMAIEYDE